MRFGETRIFLPVFRSVLELTVLELIAQFCTSRESMVFSLAIRQTDDTIWRLRLRFDAYTGPFC